MPNYATTPGVISQVLDASTVLLDINRGLYFQLNETGTLVWQGLVAAEDVDSIVRDIASVCDVATTMVRSDVDALLAELLERGLVARTP